ncbi:MAG: methyl-accepting chemotaxis protein, partial [Deltaproteobacteria bacterium]|nr:methyl-accepting chemotaxis protein [Deltaproteobacteria bacterium]
QGSDLVTKTQGGFKEVAESSDKVAGLVSEIAAASGEQAQGIDQVNTAMVQMDQVVQQSAANSEETASAAEELNAQAETMKEVVTELMAMVGGANGNKAATSGKKVTKTASKPKRLLPPRQADKKAAPQEVKPDEIIPMDGEDDLSDF